MFYKITGYSCGDDNTTTYVGEFTPVTDEPRVLTALVAVFGDEGKTVVDRLSYWAGDPELVQEWVYDAKDWELKNLNHRNAKFIVNTGDMEFAIQVGGEPFEEEKPLEVIGYVISNGDLDLPTVAVIHIGTNIEEAVRTFKRSVDCPDDEVCINPITKAR